LYAGHLSGSRSHDVRITLYYHLILTDDCNLCCSYCRAKPFEPGSADEGSPIEIDENLPVELEYDLDTLYDFLKQDPDPALTFYGGEPLLKTDMIQTIMDIAPVQRFMIQTNGLLLDRLGPEYVNRFSTILVSLDGGETLTDSHRGNGTYRKVLSNVKTVLAGGFTGELIARMTVTEDTDIVDAVTYLHNNPDHSFSSIHWQLDANFSSDFSRRSFAPWVHDRYNPGVRTLVQRWVQLMETTGRVPRWYPFLDTMDDLLHDRQSLLRCGAGHANYSIMTDGHIAPCPVMIGMKQQYLGHIGTTRPGDLGRTGVGGECTACKIRDFCGGRCLYAHIVRPWKEDARTLVCGTVENLHVALTGALPRVRALIGEGVLQHDDFAHEKFNGCEIIP
jgi:putative peptide-modifying radical SAM enzyme